MAVDIDRLHDLASRLSSYEDNKAVHAAADEIERLKQRIKTLQGSLAWEREESLRLRTGYMQVNEHGHHVWGKPGGGE